MKERNDGFTSDVVKCYTLQLPACLLLCAPLRLSECDVIFLMIKRLSCSSIFFLSYSKTFLLSIQATSDPFYSFIPEFADVSLLC